MEEQQDRTQYEITPQQLKKSGGFESMNLIYPVYRAVQFKGFNVPTPIQRKAIPLLLEGRDIVACSRTGSGKTAAFIIPLVNKLKEHSQIIGVRALIVLPTRELALQTATVLRQFIQYTDLIYTILVGGHGVQGQFESLASNPDIIIATPGRLYQHLMQNGLTLNRVEFLVFDEADYLFELGFAEQMKTILKKLSQNRQTLMFSATIPQELSQFAASGLKDYAFVKLDYEYLLNENISLNFIISRQEEKLSALVYLLKEVVKKEEKSIIFAATQYHVDLIVSILTQFQIYSVGIYGQMDLEDRKSQLNDFQSRKINILVVTDLASRGIDIPYIQNVIHYDFPAQQKTFIHRSGRTARAGRKGKVYSLIATNERMYISQILLFIGRKLSNQVEDMADNSKVLFGKIPTDIISENYVRILRLLENDPEIAVQHDVAMKAFQKFRSTRGTASKASVRSASSNIDVNQINPLFNTKNLQMEDQIEFLNQIKNFKPQQSALEIYKSQAIKMGKGKESDERLIQSIVKIKEVQSQIKDRREKNKQLRQQQQMIENSKLNKDENPEDVNAIEEDFEEEQDSQLQEFQEIEQEKKHQLIQQTVNNQMTALQREIQNGKIRDAKEQEELKDKPFKKIKKSSMLDFKNKDQYISSAPDPNKQNGLEDLNKITSTDIQGYIVAEDMQGMLNNKNKLRWDAHKKKYIMGQGDDKLKKQIVDKEDKSALGKGQGKQLDQYQTSFKKWSKSSMITLQKEGEVQDQKNVYKARQLFKRRRLYQKGYHFTEDQSNFNQKGAKSQLKRPGEIMKRKQTQKLNKLMSLSKEKRNDILKKRKESRNKDVKPKTYPNSKSREVKRGGFRGGNSGGGAGGRTNKFSKRN